MRILLIAAAIFGVVHAGPIDRPGDPLVLTGDRLPSLVGRDPGRIVAFRFEGGWVQVPVQIDERAVVDFGTIYNDTATGFTVLTYADPGTFTGADADPDFDLDDELALRLDDAGGPLAGSPADPAGTESGTGLELILDDPLDGTTGYLYLFVSDGSLDPAAGVAAIDYTFDLLSGDYKTTYGTQVGPNPEDSTVVTPSYRVHFADRWIRDETAVDAGGATGVDLLDRHKNLFAPGVCARSEDTFSAGEGAFIVNKRGPVRALRAYVGANSGPMTYRIHRFYLHREDQEIVLKVHEIPGTMDYWDYTPAASGMSYTHSLMAGSVTIDGSQDTVPTGNAEWEMVTGGQGTIGHVHTLTTDIPALTTDVYYSDRSTPEVTQCTGDAVEYGASGLWFAQTIPNTDPSQPGPVARMEAERVIEYAAPNQPRSWAVRNHAEVRNPIQVTALLLTGCPDLDLDGFAVCDGVCELPATKVCGDCSDADGAVYPGAPELCDLADNDCDGQDDEALCDEFDADGDGAADGTELSWIGRAFGLCSANPASEWWAPVDYDGDGCVDGVDLAVLSSVFGCSAGQPACD